MSANPRVVTADTTFSWDGAPFFLKAGTMLDVAAGSALEVAIGVSHLGTLSGQQLQDAAAGGSGGISNLRGS